MQLIDQPEILISQSDIGNSQSENGLIHFAVGCDTVGWWRWEGDR